MQKTPFDQYVYKLWQKYVSKYPSAGFDVSSLTAARSID